MTKNMSVLDRRLRAFAAAPLLVAIAILAGAGSAGGIVLLALAGVMLATGLVGFCPLYALLHLDTCGAKPLSH